MGRRRTTQAGTWTSGHVRPAWRMLVGRCRAWAGRTFACHSSCGRVWSHAVPSVESTLSTETAGTDLVHVWVAAVRSRGWSRGEAGRAGAGCGGRASGCFVGAAQQRCCSGGVRRRVGSSSPLLGVAQFFSGAHTVDGPWIAGGAHVRRVAGDSAGSSVVRGAVAHRSSLVVCAVAAGPGRAAPSVERAGSANTQWASTSGTCGWLRCARAAGTGTGTVGGCGGCGGRKKRIKFAKTKMVAGDPRGGRARPSMALDGDTTKRPTTWHSD